MFSRLQAYVLIPTITINTVSNKPYEQITMCYIKKQS